MRELATAADAAREGNPLAPPPLLAPAPIPAHPRAVARAIGRHMGRIALLREAPAARYLGT